MPEPSHRHPNHADRDADRDQINVSLGLSENERPAAAQLYCKAFSEKLSPFLGPLDRTIRFLTAGTALNRAFIARRAGRIVGIAGFKEGNRGLFEVPFSAFWREYGVTAPLRFVGLALLERNQEAGCLLMDGIAVDSEARGQGIGTQLLEAIESHAMTTGADRIRLEVVDTNPGARRLYERFGFVPTRETDIGIFRLIFPFRTSTTMIKQVSKQA